MSKDPRQEMDVWRRTSPRWQLLASLWVDGAPRWRGLARPYDYFAPPDVVPGFNLCLNPLRNRAHPLFDILSGVVLISREVLHRHVVAVFGLRRHLPWAVSFYGGFLLYYLVVFFLVTGPASWLGVDGFVYFTSTGSTFFGSRYLRVVCCRPLVDCSRGYWSTSSSKIRWPPRNSSFAASSHISCKCSFSV